MKKSNISDSDFIPLVKKEASGLLILANSIMENPNLKLIKTRPFIGRLNLESSKVEEFLDSCGAMGNVFWFPFREKTAAIKLFSQILYILIHLQYASYPLLKIKEDFSKELEENIEVILSAIIKAAGDIINESRQKQISLSASCDRINFDGELYTGVLTQNKKVRHIEKPEKTVVYLATSFLNLSEESRLFEIHHKIKKSEYAQCIPDTISEEKLRGIEQKFHNLQSLYDTYIINSDIESFDKNLPVLRGHISVIFHLLEIATKLSHYYERHMVNGYNKGNSKFIPPISKRSILKILMKFSVAFSSLFLEAATELCRQMLKQYAIQGEIIVNIPPYRGFHIRPSTLIAAIVNHYGSDVFLIMEEEKYDASQPLEVFRLNEKINSQKRKYIAQSIDKLSIVHKNDDKRGKEVEPVVRKIFSELLTEGKVILYEQITPFPAMAKETAAEYAKRYFAHFLALGNIDIQLQIRVSFSGDQRVLNDIKILADHGYGEDKFGNNIALPSELAYLKR